jgi:hypothetical protein
LAFGDPGTVATTKASTLNVSNEGSTWRSQFSAILTNFRRIIWRFFWKLMLRSILGRKQRYLGQNWQSLHHLFAETTLNNRIEKLWK